MDMDGTVVQYQGSSFHSSWDAIGIATGKREEWLKAGEQYYHNIQECEKKRELEQAKYLYLEWFDLNCRMLEGTEVEKVKAQIFPPPYTPGFSEFCAYLEKTGIIRGIVSSGVDLVANRIKEELNLEFAVANKLHLRDGKFSGSGEMDVPLWKKGEIVTTVMHAYSIDSSEVAYIGDHENDVGAWEKVAWRLGMNLKLPELFFQVDEYFHDFHEVKGWLKSKFNSSTK